MAVPRFDFPLRYDATGHIAEVEQDTTDDAIAAVMLSATVELGSMAASPTLGIPDHAFDQQPLGAEQIAAELAESSPRAEIVAREEPDRYDALLDRIAVLVGGAGGG